jgi:hypothetical protein
MSKVVVELTQPQAEFVYATDPFPAFVGGFGSGKTHAGVWRALVLKFEQPQNDVAYYLPSYDLISRIAFPRFAECLDMMKVPYVLSRAEKVITILGGGKIILRTMDTPELIVGYEVGDSVIDELDTLKTDKAGDIWRKIVARNRQKKTNGRRNTVAVVTTPEGFRFVYNNWKRKPFAGSKLITASTYTNAINLPDGYIDSLKATYPDTMLAAYLDGQFVNLTQGSVYPHFDRKLNAMPLGLGIMPGEHLHIGCDFNVGRMAAVVHIIRDNVPMAVAEFSELVDTPHLIREIKRRYVDVPVPHKIFAYPDASGGGRHSVNASASDISLMSQARFIVLAASKNPFIRDRVAAFNKMIYKDGTRLYKVNIDNCPHLVECLEKQAYTKNGEPDKTSGLDHLVDAAGYFISYRYPIQHGKVIQMKLKGL